MTEANKLVRLWHTNLIDCTFTGVCAYILLLSSQPKISKYKNKPPVYQKHKLETILIIIFNYIRNNFLPFLAKPATPNESPAVNTYNKPLCVSPVWTLVGDTVSFFACDILSWFATLLETFSFAVPFYGLLA